MHLVTLPISVLLLTLTAAKTAAPVPGRASLFDSCPHIHVEGPPESVPAGDPITFTASISGADPAVRYTFRWTVSAGKITGGQDTSRITVDSTGLGGGRVKATVVVGGMPDRSCPDSKSA